MIYSLSMRIGTRSGMTQVSNREPYTIRMYLNDLAEALGVRELGADLTPKRYHTLIEKGKLELMADGKQVFIYLQ